MEAWVACILTEGANQVLLVVVEAAAGICRIHVGLGFELVTRDAMFVKLGSSGRIERSTSKLRVHLINSSLH